MKIIFIHQYFRTPEEGGGIRTYYLAKQMIEDGYEVELITAHNNHAYAFKCVEGINVHYLPVYYENKLGFVARSWAFIKFVFAALFKALSIRNASLCYAVTTPLTVGLICIFLKKLKGLPYLIEIGDLWPEAPIQMGAIKNPVLQRFLYWFEKQVYTQAKALIPYSISIEQAIKAKGVSTPTHVITNLADCKYFYPEEKQAGLVRKYGVEGKFVISYTGTIGLANQLEYLVYTAQACALRSMTQVHFVVVGEGARLEAIKKLSSSLLLTNISFIGHTGKSGVKEVLNITDAAFISYLNKPVLETGCPNKYFDALAAGKLVIVNMRGWIKEEIEARQCGFYTDPEKPETFPDQLLPFLQKTALLDTFKNNARRLALEKYATDLQLAKFSAILRTYI